ncbi:MAG: hypothetical protein ACE14P_12900 [Methanotrichaceae archaeon]
MQRIAVLTLLVLSLLVLPLLGTTTLAAVGGNSSELAPDLVGQLNRSNQTVTAEEESLWLRMRTLWLENVFWTRAAMVSVIQGCDNRASVQSRLIRNCRDLEMALSPHLGNDSATKYGGMIEKNTQLTIDLATAVGNNNLSAFESINKSMLENADSIAAFENSSIAKLPIDDRKAMWHNYLNLTRNETTELASKDYNASINTFDLLEEQINLMADSLTNGIIQNQ